MKTLTLSWFAAVWLLAPALLRGADPNDANDSAAKAAIAWIKTHDKYKGDGLLNSLIKTIEASQKKGQNMALNVPATASDTGYEMLWLINGSFQTFHLTEPQAKSLEFNDSTIPTYMGGHAEKISDKPVARLSDVVIDNADKIDGSKKITGTVSCKTLARSSDQYVIRIWYVDHKSGTTPGKPGLDATNISSVPGKLPENGKVKFSFNLDDSPGLSHGYKGALVVFVSLCKFTPTPDGLEPTFYSNTVGTVINIEGK